MNGPKEKILYLMASPAWGGGEQYVADLILGMERMGYECYAVVPLGGELVAEKLEAVLPPERIFMLRMRSMFDVASIKEVSRIVQRVGNNVIHANKFADAFIAAKARRIARNGAKVIMTRHLVRKGKTGRLYRKLYSELDRMVFVSDMARREFLSAGAEIDPGKVYVVHTGVADAPQVGDRPGTMPPVIAFAGRVVPEKGLDVLFEALKDITSREFNVKIIGSGEDKYIDSLKQKAADGGFAEKVRFTGFTDDVNGELQEASIGVLPSIVPEGFGLAAVEYMRASLAVVTTGNGAQREFLDDGKEALIVPPGDARALGEALDKLLSDGDMCRRLGQAGRKRYEEELSFDKYIGRMDGLYKSLLAVDN